MMSFPYIDMTATGANLKSLLKKSGYTPATLQKILGLGGVQAVYKWMQGVTLPSTDNLMALAWLLNVRIEDILVCVYPNTQHTAA